MKPGRAQALGASATGRAALALISLALLAAWAFDAAAGAAALSRQDGQPGLSLRDVELRYHGDRGRSRFAAQVQGGMLAHLADPADAARLPAGGRGPGAAGAEEPRRAYEQWVRPVLARDCAACHVPGGEPGATPMRSYHELEPLLAPDRGGPWTALAQRSGRHLGLRASLAAVTAALAFAFLPRRQAGILSCLAASGLLLEVGGWWATRLTAQAAPLVPLGALCFGAGLLLALLGLLQRCLLPVTPP